MIVYKLVHRVGARLTSLNKVSPALCLTYVPGKWTEGKLGPLFAFSTYEYANNYRHSFDMSEVWRAEAEDVKSYVPEYLPQPGMLEIADPDRAETIIKAFWNFSIGIDLTYAVVTPSGTVLCRRIKLLEKLS